MATRMTEPQKRNCHPKYKTPFRVKNWREYEQSLRARSDITLWINQDAIDAWTPLQTGKQGAQPVYSDIAIETAIALRLLFHLPLRQTEGFLGSVLRLMGLSLRWIILPCRVAMLRRRSSGRWMARLKNPCRSSSIAPD